MTRIVDLGLRRLRVPFRAPVRYDAAELEVLDLLLVRLATDDGLVGWGEAKGHLESTRVAARAGTGAAGAGSTLPSAGTGAAAEGWTRALPDGPTRAAEGWTRAAPEGGTRTAAPGPTHAFVEGSTPVEASELEARLRGIIGRVLPVDQGPLPSALATTLADLRAALPPTFLGRVLGGAIETAALDLIGRRLDRPLAALLGGDPPARIAVNGLVRADHGSVDRVLDESDRQLRTGIRTLKLKAGDPAELAAALQAIRSAVGPEVRLRVDWNGRLTADEAVVWLRRLEWAELEYVEDPIPAEAGPDGYARLRAAVGVPIAVDAGVVDLPTAEALLAAGACDVLVVKPGRLGGPLAALRIVEAARARGVSTTISTTYETGIGLAAALHLAATVPGHHVHGLATANLLADDLLVESLGVEAGRIAVPAGPGLGVTVDEAAVARYAVGGAGGGRR